MASNHLQPPDDLRVRAFAVAKLKRAASLPRMKDGRRPPMHGEAVSEGERATPSPVPTPASTDSERDPPNVEDHDNPVTDATPHEHTSQPGPSSSPSYAHQPMDEPPQRDPDPEPEPAEDEQEQEHEQEQEQEQESAQSRTTTPTTQRRKKRRSRSRSRSRSKDFSQSRPDSPDEAGAPPPPVPVSPFLASTIPSPMFTPQPQTPTGRPYPSPHSPFFQSPTSPSPLPSLDAIRAGLIRSNSAAGRMMAFHKLTGGTESPEPMSLSPSPAPLTRSNTVTGGERMAARAMMLRRLGERVKADGETPSISEEPPVTPTRRRPIPADLVTTPSRNPQTKRSPPASIITNGIVDDREVSETSPNSPVQRSLPLAMPESESMTTTPVPDNTSSRRRSSRRETGSSRMTDQGPFEYDAAEVRDGVVIERDEPESAQSGSTGFKTQSSFTMGSPAFGPSARSHLKRNASGPSDTSSTLTASTAEPIPVFMGTQGERSPYKQDTFPVAISPFGTPNKESIIAESEEENDNVVYPEDMKARKAWLDKLENEAQLNLSWGGQLPEVGSSSLTQSQWSQSVQSADDEDDDDVPVSKVQARSPPSAFNSKMLDSVVSASSFSSHHLTSDAGASPSPEASGPGTSPSPHHLHQAIPSERTSRASESASQASSSMRAPSAAALHKTPDPHEQLTDWEDVQTDKDVVTAPKEKKSRESPWQKVRAFARSGSSMGMHMGGGRRSRSNSFVNAKKEDSSRESAASANSVTNLASPTAMMNPAASSSMLSLSPHPVVPPRGGVSPVPPASAADLARYADHSKLMPFPGLAKLQEEKMQRDRGMSGESSLVSNGPETPEREHLERRPSISKQTSKGSPTQLGEGASLSRNNSQTKGHSDRPKSPGRAPTPSATNTSSPLPTSREGVRKWLGLNTKKWLGSSAEHQTHNVEIVPPGTAMKPPERKPSLSELIASNQMSDSATEKEDSARHARPPQKAHAPETPTKGALDAVADLVLTPAAEEPSSFVMRSETESDSPPLPTPSSMNSFNQYSPERSSDSSPNPSANQSFPIIPAPRENTMRLEERRTAAVLEKLDTILEQAARDPARSSALDSPPRKLLLMSKAFQVLDRNTIKDRYLFLFSDILVIAKPMDDEPGREVKKTPLDQYFAVKSIVELTKLDFQAYREGEGPSALGGDFNKHPAVRLFIQRFAKGPDHAIATFLEKASLKDDHMAIANLLFRAVDLDKTQLGEYLSRRTSKNILKSFIDRFGFAGVRIDNALRAFLLSIRLPGDANLLEHLLITFASRWFEANMGIVAFDKEVAARLVFAMMQLNDALHSDLYSEMTPAGGVFSFPNRNISSRDFIEAFRVWDRRMLVSDDVLENIHSSIQRQKFAQGLDSSLTPIATEIYPAAIPSRLTTRIPSETITIRIPAPDPEFGIHLQGQDLLFEPPFLSFARSAEVSFRVIGNGLGTKTAIFARTGANANLYSGLPLSKSFQVERAFMRNTFRVSFTNHVGLARKYLFSVDNKADHASWATLLQRHIEKCKAEPVNQPLGPVSAKVRKAAEAVALRVLRDALIVPDNEPTKATSAAMSKGASSKTSAYPMSPGMVHSRSDGSSDPSSTGTRGTVKSGHDLLVVCQQNSLIPLVLSFLNVVKPI